MLVADKFANSRLLIRYPRGWDHLPDGFPARRVDSTNSRSLALRAELYVARLPSAPFSARVGVATKRKARWQLANGLLVLATSYSRTAYRRTTIGAAAFHCRVRNGNGWGHRAIVTRDPSRIGGPSRTGGFGASRPTRISGDDVDLLKNFGSLISTYRK